MGRTRGKPHKGQPKGARTANGRLRKPTAGIQRVEPCEGIIRRRAFCGVPANDTDTTDAIGRAFVVGLLGTDERAKDMLVGARRIHDQYWIAYGIRTRDSLDRFQPTEPGRPMTEEQRAERDRIREQVLTDTLKTLDGMGRLRNVREAFNQLVIDIHPDSGPDWLDRLIVAKRGGKPAGERDWHMLDLAKQGLGVVA